MWNYFKSIFFNNDNNNADVSLTPAEEDDLINSLYNPEDVDTYILKEFNDYETEDRIGVITSLDDNVAVIDNVYYFHFTPSTTMGIHLNDKVKFTVYFNEIDTIIKNLEKIEDSEQLTNDVEINTPSDRSEINANVHDISTISGQIYNRERRLFEVKIDNKNENIQFNLNNVKSEFIPYLGDYVKLDIVGETSKNIEILQLHPKKTALKMGIITSWDNKYGTISNFAIFTKSVCEAGFEPAVGYKVCASLIRSDCLNGYKWRAYQVIPQTNILCNSSLPSNQLKQLEEEFRNKRGISVAVCNKITLKQSEQLEFKVVVSNKSSLDHAMSVYPTSKSEHNQIITFHSTLDNITIKAGGVFEITFKIIGKFVGKSYEDFMYDFKDFKIRRRLIFEVLCDQLMPDSKPNIIFDNHFSRHIWSKNIIDKSEGEIYGGRRKSSLGFIPVKISEYPLPKVIIETILPENGYDIDGIRISLEILYPWLKTGLNPDNYKSYMHSLLFFEEVELLKKVSLLDIDNASFVKYLDFLILNVPEDSFYTKILLVGDYVLVSLPWNKEKKMQGIIHKITKRELWLKFSKHFHSEYKEGSTYCTNFVQLRTTLRRCHQAIDVAFKNLGTNWLFPSCVTPQPPQIMFDELEDGTSPFEVENILQPSSSTFSDDPILSKYMGRGRGKKSVNYQGPAWNCAGTGYGRRINSKEYKPDINIETTKVNKIEWFNTSLNIQQKKAVLRVLYGVARPLPYIIFGPPGTGKTITIVEVILQVYTILPKSKILVSCPTNSAADLLAVRLMDSGNLPEGDLLRLVGLTYADQGRLTASLIPYSATPSFKDKEDDTEFPAFRRDQIAEHRIVVATLGTLGTLYSMGFPQGFFTHIFIDEVGQANEPEFLLSTVFLSLQTGNIILSGDPLQLGPVVFSKFSESYGLQDSFLVRILGRFPYIRDAQGFSDNYGYDPRLITKLIYNYRSIDGILQVFNSLFYEGDLVPKISNETSDEASLLSKLKSFNITCPVIFHGLCGSTMRDEASKSCYNPQEVFQVFCYLNKLYYDGVHPDDIGIITPYQAHAKKIEDVLDSQELETPKIGTVEEFQGQERMVIILSLARSSENLNDLLNVSFVTNPRRVNVAISRARALLIIIGDPGLLDQNKIWHKILKYCVANKSYIGCQLPQRLTLKH